MIILKIRDFVDDTWSLSSRRIATKIRKSIENLLEQNVNGGIVIDFEGIDLITQSFADELFGVLIRENGISSLKMKIKFANVTPLVRNVITFVLSYSSEMSKKREVVA